MISNIDWTALGIISASAAAVGVIIYLKRLKSRIKRYVLRSREIEKYFKEEI